MHKITHRNHWHAQTSQESLTEPVHLFWRNFTSLSSASNEVMNSAHISKYFKDTYVAHMCNFKANVRCKEKNVRNKWKDTSICSLNVNI